MLAVEAPVRKLLAVGGIALALAAGFAMRSHRHHHHHVHTLTLHAPEKAGAVYVSIFGDGPVLLDREDGQTEPLAFEACVQTIDSCTWIMRETLTPIDARTYAYDYSETRIACDRNASPDVYIYATPRQGTVVVDE